MSQQKPGDLDARKVSRRSFLSHVGAAGMVAAAAPALAAAGGTATGALSGDAAREKIEGAIPVSLRINGKLNSLEIDPRTTLLDALRETLNLTGTKKGC